MQITVLFFAALRELVGGGERTVQIPLGSDVAGLIADLVNVEPQLAAVLGQVRLAVNESFVELDHPLAAGDTVAFIPPVAGG